MTSEVLDLDAIEARAAAATPGPWTATRRPGEDLHFGVMEFTQVDSPTKNLFAVASMPLADAEFIAAARADVPALATRLREREAEVRRLRRQIEREAADVKAELSDAARQTEQVEATVAKVESLLAEWNRLGRGEGIHGRQLRSTLEDQEEV